MLKLWRPLFFMGFGVGQVYAGSLYYESYLYTKFTLYHNCYIPHNFDYCEVFVKFTIGLLELFMKAFHNLELCGRSCLRCHFSQFDYLGRYQLVVACDAPLSGNLDMRLTCYGGCFHYIAAITESLLYYQAFNRLIHRL